MNRATSKGIFPTRNSVIIRNPQGINVRKCCTTCQHWQINRCGHNLASSFSARNEVYCDEWSGNATYLKAGKL